MKKKDKKKEPGLKTCIAQQNEVSNWILTSCLPHRVISGDQTLLKANSQ